MSKYIRLALSLLVCVQAWAFLGLCSTEDSGAPVWLGVGMGSAIGLFLGLAIGGSLPAAVADFFCPGGGTEPRSSCCGSRPAGWRGVGGPGGGGENRGLGGGGGETHYGGHGEGR